MLTPLADAHPLGQIAKLVNHILEFPYTDKTPENVSRCIRPFARCVALPSPTSIKEKDARSQVNLGIGS